MNKNRRIRLLIGILALELLLWFSLKTDKIIPKEKLLFFKKQSVVEKAHRYSELRRFDFIDPQSVRQWEEKVFKGKTSYLVVRENGESFLRGESRNASSGLYQKFDFEVTPDLAIRWQWRARTFPIKKEPLKLGNRREDDFAARLYVIFPGTNFFNTNVIEYIWDAALPIGASSSSPFSDRIQLVVIRSGAPDDSQAWVSETRNIFDDYKTFFKKNPDRRIGAIALMSDSDNTNTQSAADFKFIELIKLKKEVSS